MLELATIENNSQSIAEPQSLQDCFNNWGKWLYVSKTSARTYFAGVKAFLTWQSSNNIQEPTKADIIAFLNDLEAAGKSPSTRATYLAGLKAFFAWLEEQGFYTNITARVKAPKIDKEPKKDALTVKQLRKVIGTAEEAGIKALRNKAILTLISSCGLRTIEVSRANIDDIRAKNGQSVLYIHGKGKNEKAKFIPLPNIAKRAIEAYLAVRGKTAKNAPLFVSMSTNKSNGEALSTRSISNICKQALIRAGFNSRRITAHSLRHSVATEALRYGASVHSVQLYLRHSDVNTTLIYAHEIEQEQNECCRLLDRLLTA